MHIRKAIRGAGWAAAIGAIVLVALPATASASTLGGTATIDAPGTTTPLTGTQSATTEFTVALPFEAACSADTSSAGTHEFSYFVPAGTSPTTLTFSSGYASNNLGLVDNNGNPWDDVDTAPTSGDVIGIANDYEFGPLVSNSYISLSSLLYSGTTGVWEAGIACANSSGVLTDYWNTEVTFVASSGSFTWSAVAGLGSQAPEVALAVTLPVAGAAILGSGLWFSRRRSRRRALLAHQSAT